MTDQLNVPETNPSDRESNRANKAYGALMAALLIIGWLPILLRLSEATISPNATIFNRLWIATAILALWNGGEMLGGRSLHTSSLVKNWPTRQTLRLLLVQGAVFASFQLLWAWSLIHTSVANSEVLHSLTPLFTVSLGWWMFGRQFDRLLLTGIAIALVGSISLSANDFSIAADKLTGDGIALLSALFWALFLLLGEKLQQQMDAMALTTWNCFLGTGFIIPILLATGENLFPQSGSGWSIALLLGVSAVGTQNLIFYSLNYLSSGLVSTILLLNPIVSALLAWTILSESLNLINWLASAIVLLGIYVAMLSQKQYKWTEKSTFEIE